MRVLITGVTGQDGSYLAQQLTEVHGHRVFGLVRWHSTAKAAWLRELVPSIELLSGDLIDQSSLERALAHAEPEVVYHLGAIASSSQSWTQPLMMVEVNALGTLKLLEAIRVVNPAIRVVHASTSEQYGEYAAVECPQTVTTPFGSLNVYGAAKTFAHHVMVNYRESYGMHLSTALMHNHVSPRRSPDFVDRKITRAVARISLGLQDELVLGNMEPARDFGWGPEYMTAWPLIAQRDTPDDYIIATGEAHTVREFVEAAFSAAGISSEGRVRSDPALFRPTDVQEMRGYVRRTEEKLGWRANVRFDEIVGRLVEQDIAEAKASL